MIEAAVREADDEELPPDIEFSLCGQHFEMSIERFAVHLGIYYEPETVRDDFTQAPTQGEEGVMRAWWSQVSDTPFTRPQVKGANEPSWIIVWIWWKPDNKIKPLIHYDITCAMAHVECLDGANL
ncbi:hypothetical protein E3N88_37192 [Mikania micrantha]|uniref:Uncharacterized protein n=1 Tax=Mikania micrantha TaxID=192012 RepID=A0A5N6M6C8_9ASTR|nr:hypothetical protein E3N88_37192 [Mikania micrantha]